ncbi:MAG: tyrosine-type recombinase/integrase [Magnetococcales bacterium]|nr:tyrosine-type recombinase/integrase [Magnetococcales bacterium]
MKLTQSAIDSFIYEGADNSRDVRWDDAIPGFGIRIYPSGKKAFVISYRQFGRKRMMTLGNYGVLTLKQAQAKAREELVKVTEGEDPLEAKRQQAHGTTVADLCTVYWEKHGQLKRSSRDDRRHIDLYLLPHFGSRQVKSITRSDIARLHGEISKKAPIQANRVLSLVSRMFKLAQVWGMLDEGAPNPVFGIPKNPECVRDRWVTSDELPRLAQAIDESDNLYARAALWLYLLLGVRKMELLAAKWEHIDWTRKELRIPETKAGRVHYIPLTPSAVAILENLPREDGNPYILPGRVPGQHLVNIFKPWNRVRQAAGVADVRLHDLRRTVGSWLAQSGNSLHLIGRVLNHSNTSTTQIYARFGQDTVRAALESHDKQIMAVARGESADVVNLPTHRTNLDSSLLQSQTR